LVTTVREKTSQARKQSAKQNKSTDSAGADLAQLLS